MDRRCKLIWARPLATLLVCVALAHADGVWHVYHAGSSGLPWDNVTALACDSLGNVWVGTEAHGTVIFNGADGVLYRGVGVQQKCIVSTITVSSKNIIYIGYNGGGLGVVTKKEFAALTASDVDLPSDNVQALAADARGGVWIGTSHGIGERTRSGEWRRDDADLPDRHITALATDRAGRAWIGFGNASGLAMYDGNTITPFNPDNSTMPDARVNAILVDNDGAVWAATESSGVVKLDHGEVKIFSTENCGIPSNKVYCIACDYAGRIWVGTSDGAAMYDGAHWTAYTAETTPLPNNQVFAITVDRRNRVWFGTPDGLASFTPPQE